MLSSSTASARPTASTSRSCSSVSTSISILTRWPAQARARSSTARIAAGDRDVVVLDQHGVVEAEAVVEAAAAAHRVFLQRAQAGRGLARAADAHVGAGDAAHEFVRGAWRRRTDGRVRLSAARSAASTARAGPVTVISAVLAATLAPSRAWAVISISGASLRNAAATSGSPAITPALRATTTARAGEVFRNGGDRRHVAGAAEILGQRARHRVVDLER